MNINKKIKRLISVCLSLALICGMLCTLPVTGLSDISNPSDAETEEYIYYTDLFYAYPTYLIDNSYFNDYNNAVDNVYTCVFNEYKNSPAVIGTGIEKAMDLFTSPSDIFNFATDALGLTNYDTNNAIDSANKKIMLDFFSNGNNKKVMGGYQKVDDIFENIEKMCGYLDDIYYYDPLDYLDNEDADSLEYKIQYYISSTYNKMASNGMLKKFDNLFVSRFYELLKEKKVRLKDCFDTSTTVMDITRAYLEAVIIEDAKLEIIDEIIASQSTDTLLKQGMTRLKNQLAGGSVTYFADVYVKDKALQYLGESIGKALTSGWSTYKALSESVKIVKDIVFSFWDVPKYDDIISYKVFVAYSYNLTDSIHNATKRFMEDDFLSDEILQFESLFSVYEITNKYAVQLAQKIAHTSDPLGETYAILTEAKENNEDIILTTEKGIKINISSAIDYGELHAILLGETVVSNFVDLSNVPLGNKIKVANSKNAISISITAGKFVTALLNGCFNCYVLLQEFENDYGTEDVFETVILKTKETILGIPKDQRITIDFKNRHYTMHNGTELHRQSDAAVSNCIYAVNGYIRGTVRVQGNVSINGEIGIDGDFVCATSDKIAITIKSGAVFSVLGNVEFQTLCPNWLYKGDTYLRIDENARMDVKENFLLQGSGVWGHDHYANLYIDGTLNVEKDFISDNAFRIFETKPSSYFKVSQDFKNNNVYCGGTFTDGVLEVRGDYYGGGISVVESCKVVLSGREKQNIQNLKASSVFINNLKGIRYLTDTYINGLYDTKGSQIENNGFVTVITDATRFIENYDYKKLRLQSNINLTQSVKADIETTGYSIAVPENAAAIIDGNVNLNKTSINVYGQLIVTGNINVANNSAINNYNKTEIGSIYLATMNFYAGRNSIANAGYFEIVNKFESCSDTYANSRSGYRIIQENDDAALVIGGEFLANTGDVCDTITKGTVIFNGSSQQNVKNIMAPIIIINNDSSGGVVFKSAISPSALFDHRGNKFTLYNNGVKSSFVDYDGDGVKDNVDPHPTISELCVDENGDEKHIFTNYVSDGNSSCGHDGTKTAICDVCGIATHTVTDIGSAQEHILGKYKITKIAPENGTGEKSAVCQNCHETVTVQYSVGLYGDVNGDGEVNGNDITDLSRYIAKWPGVILDSEPAADVNVDGEINGNDAADLSRYVAKWPGATLGT